MGEKNSGQHDKSVEFERRRLLQASAWATPVIAAAVAAPLAAATGPQPGLPAPFKITAFGGWPNFGTEWGTPGKFTFNATIEEPWGGTAVYVTLTLYYEKNGAYYEFPTGKTLGGNVTTWPVPNTEWVVPGGTEKGSHKFVLVAKAPGYISEKREISITVS